VIRSHIEVLKKDLDPAASVKLDDFVHSKDNPRAITGTLVPHVDL